MRREKKVSGEQEGDEMGEKRKRRTLTSKIPSSMVKRETSKVPPPRSKMRTFRSPRTFLSSLQIEIRSEEVSFEPREPQRRRKEKRRLTRRR